MGRIAGVTPEETRERLVDAAARVFELKGYEGATVAEIAKEAGVSTGAIYAHYSGKAGLLVEALRTHAERATSALFPPGTKIDAADVLRTLAAQLTRNDHADRALLAEAALGARRDAELAQVLADAFVDRELLMAEVIAAGQRKGVLSEDVAPDVAARFTLMLGLGSMLVTELDLPPVDQMEWNALTERIVAAFTQPSAAEPTATDPMATGPTATGPTEADPTATSEGNQP